MADMQACGIADKIIMGPWMRLFYKGDEGHYYESIGKVTNFINIV